MTEYVDRPTPYPREPFQLASGELVAFEGRYYSAPAYALLLDMRLMSSSSVTNPFKLYINKDAGLEPTIEPTLEASGYEDGTPHYVDYITDMRDALDFVINRHVADSEHQAVHFKTAHLTRQREPYDIDNTSASGIGDAEYVHATPEGPVPTGLELGAAYIQDIDLDEVMWQPFTRPKDFATGPAGNIPTEPIFPMVMDGGSLPTFSTLDKEIYGDMGLDCSSSGGFLVTGDRLETGTSLKVSTGSGASFSQGSFVREIPWGQHPIGTGLGQFYGSNPPNSDVLARGRQAIYAAPGGTADSVLLVDVSETGTSGQVIQTWPANYQATSGVRGSDNKIHNGMHNTSKLLYSLQGGSPRFLTGGHSPINGKLVFGHHMGEETGSAGQTIGVLKYADGNTIYGWGGAPDPRIGQSNQSLVEVMTTNQRFSPVSWRTFPSTALGVAIVPFSRPPIEYTVHDYADTQHSENDGTVSRKVYAGWGYIDQMVCPDKPGWTGGQEITSTITYTTYTYNENGMGGWVLQMGSPTTRSEETVHRDNTYGLNNIFSFFFFRRGRRNHGFVNVNGNIYHQWGEQTDPIHKFAPLGARFTQLVPPTSRSTRISSIGFFPSWKLVLTITTNNQVVKPTEMIVSPAASALITFGAEYSYLAISDVDTFGPAVWDPDEGVNYLYFKTKDTAPDGGKIYFAHMNTSFEIERINEVNDEDAILFGRMALLSL